MPSTEYEGVKFSRRRRNDQGFWAHDIIGQWGDRLGQIVLAAGEYVASFDDGEERRFYTLNAARDWVREADRRSS